MPYRNGRYCRPSVSAASTPKSLFQRKGLYSLVFSTHLVQFCYRRCSKSLLHLACCCLTLLLYLRDRAIYTVLGTTCTVKRLDGRVRHPDTGPVNQGRKNFSTKTLMYIGQECRTSSTVMQDTRGLEPYSHRGSLDALPFVLMPSGNLISFRIYEESPKA